MQRDREYYLVEGEPQEVNFGEYNRWYLDVILPEAQVVRDRLVSHSEVATTITVDEGLATQAELSVRLGEGSVYIRHAPHEGVDGETSEYGYLIEPHGLVIVDAAGVEIPVDMALLETAPVLTGAHQLAFLAARLLG